MNQIQGIADAFLTQYYNTMKLDRESRMALVQFYSEVSQITYSGSKFIGLKQIEEKVQSLSYNTIDFAEMKSDVQAGPLPGSFLVFVSGYLQMDKQNQFAFTQLFNICPNGQGGYYIHNDFFTVVNPINAI